MSNYKKSIRFYKEKSYFTIRVKGQFIMARTACIVLRYTDSSNNRYVLTIKERADKNIVDFPGGKVEIGDADIYDTGFREIWEEVILKDQLGDENHKHLKNWNTIRDDIIASQDPDQTICCQIYNAIKSCQIIPYGGGALRNVYFIVDITADQADYLINTHNMIPIGVEIINHIVDHNNSKKSTYGTPSGYHRRDTYFYSNGDIYKLRGRDFQGMFRFAKVL